MEKELGVAEGLFSGGAKEEFLGGIMGGAREVESAELEVPE